MALPDGLFNTVSKYRVMTGVLAVQCLKKNRIDCKVTIC